jgi:hypothetical protein
MFLYWQQCLTDAHHSLIPLLDIKFAKLNAESPNENKISQNEIEQISNSENHTAIMG